MQFIVCSILVLSIWVAQPVSATVGCLFNTPTCGMAGTQCRLFQNPCLMSLGNAVGGSSYAQVDMARCAGNGGVAQTCAATVTVPTAPTTPTQKCPIPCDQTVATLCAQEGTLCRQFKNQCMLNKYNCNQNRKYTLVANTKCTGITIAPKTCT